jgi:hypothetical protein
MVKVVCGDGSAVVAELRKLHTVLASGGGVDPGAVIGPADARCGWRWDVHATQSAEGGEVAKCVNPLSIAHVYFVTEERSGRRRDGRHIQVP